MAAVRLRYAPLHDKVGKNTESARMYIRDFIIGFCNCNLIVTCTLH